MHGDSWPDAFPADDVGVRRFISQFYLSGRKITAAEARVFAGRWGSWKGFAAYYLEVANLLGIRPTVQGLFLLPFSQPAGSPIPKDGTASRSGYMLRRHGTYHQSVSHPRSAVHDTGS